MKILIDIGHPAHVHYFRNMINEMSLKGHSFCIVARDKEVTHELLNYYKIKYTSRGKGGKGFIGKLIYLFKANYYIYKISKNFKPDILVSFASPYAAQVSFIINKPHISFTDTEHAKLGNLAFSSFTKTILTPNCLPINFGKKHIMFNGFMEQSYLHSKYFKPDIEIYDELNISKNQKYIIIRFVSWEASHDFGKQKLASNEKILLVKQLSKKYKVFVSSESKLPNEINQYAIKISPHRIHHAIYYASLFIGEGATMASESVMLGTPALYVNSLKCSTCDQQEYKYGLLYNFRNMNGVIEKALNILNRQSDKNEYIKKRDILFNDKINVTEFMIWFIENYPESIKLKYKDKI